MDVNIFHIKDKNFKLILYQNFDYQSILFHENLK